MWSIGVFNTISGAPLLPHLSGAAGSWRRSLGAGSGQHIIQLRDANTPLSRSVARQISEPNATTTVVMWDGSPVYAGLNLRGVYKRSTGELTLHHQEGVRGLFRQRFTFGVSTYPGGDLTVTSKSPTGVVRAIVSRGAGGSWGSTWDLPIDLPTDSAGSLSFSWKKYEWHLIDDLLNQVEKLGNEIEFEPYIASNGYLRWTTRVSSKLSGPTHEFVVTAHDTPVTDLEVTRDGTEQLSGCFYLGKGYEADMRFGEAGFVGGPTIPVRDAARSAKDVESTSKLDQMAMTDLLANRSPIEQWDFSLTVEDGGPVNVAGLRTGSTLRMFSYGDAFLTDGAHEMRLIGLSGDMSRTVKPEVQPA